MAGEDLDFVRAKERFHDMKQGIASGWWGTDWYYHLAFCRKFTTRVYLGVWLINALPEMSLEMQEKFSALHQPDTMKNGIRYI